MYKPCKTESKYPTKTKDVVNSMMAAIRCLFCNPCFKDAYKVPLPGTIQFISKGFQALS